MDGIDGCLPHRVWDVGLGFGFWSSEPGEIRGLGAAVEEKGKTKKLLCVQFGVSKAVMVWVF